MTNAPEHLVLLSVCEYDPALSINLFKSLPSLKCVPLQVQELIDKNRSELLERRYTFPVGKLMGAVREKLKWADGKLVKDVIEKQVKPRVIDPFGL